MSEPGRIDVVVFHPEQTAYDARIYGRGLPETIAPHMPSFVLLACQGHGRLRLWFADDMSDPRLWPNPRADYMLARLGYPYTWSGPVAVSMEQDSRGDYPPMTAAVLDTLTEFAGQWTGEVAHHSETTAPARVVE